MTDPVTAATLNIAFGETGADLLNRQLQEMRMQFDLTRTKAVSFYSDTERLVASMSALSAKTLLVSNVTKDMIQAMRMAQPMAKEMLTWTRELAVYSPFGQAGVSGAFKTAQMFGFTQKEAQRAVSAMVDLAAATGQTEEVIGRALYALGQMKTAGKVMGQDMMQLLNANIPAWEYLAKGIKKAGSETAYTIAEIKQLQQSGALASKKAVEAIISGIERDFAGAARRQSGTIAGLMNSWEDLTRYANEYMTADTVRTLQPLFQKAVDALGTEKNITKMREYGAVFGGMAEQARLFADTQLDRIPVVFAELEPGIKTLSTMGKTVADNWKGIALVGGTIATALMPVQTVAAGLTIGAGQLRGWYDLRDGTVDVAQALEDLVPLVTGLTAAWGVTRIPVAMDQMSQWTKRIRENGESWKAWVKSVPATSLENAGWLRAGGASPASVDARLHHLEQQLSDDERRKRERARLEQQRAAAAQRPAGSVAERASRGDYDLMAGRIDSITRFPLDVPALEYPKSTGPYESLYDARITHYTPPPGLARNAPWYRAKRIETRYGKAELDRYEQLLRQNPVMQEMARANLPHRIQAFVQNQRSLYTNDFDRLAQDPNEIELPDSALIIPDDAPLSLNHYQLAKMWGRGFSGGTQKPILFSRYPLTPKEYRALQVVGSPGLQQFYKRWRYPDRDTRHANDILRLVDWLEHDVRSDFVGDRFSSPLRHRDYGLPVRLDAAGNGIPWTDEELFEHPQDTETMRQFYQGEVASRPDLGMAQKKYHQYMLLEHLGAMKGEHLGLPISGHMFRPGDEEELLHDIYRLSGGRHGTSKWQSADFDMMAGGRTFDDLVRETGTGALDVGKSRTLAEIIRQETARMQHVLTPQELFALKMYTESASADRLKAAMWAGRRDPLVDLMNEAWREARMPEPVTLYRKTSLEEFEASKRGDYVRLPYQSWSTRPDVPHTEPVLLRTRIPRGAPAYFLKGISYVPQEDEVLLPGGMRMQHLETTPRRDIHPAERYRTFEDVRVAFPSVNRQRTLSNDERERLLKEMVALRTSTDTATFDHFGGRLSRLLRPRDNAFVEKMAKLGVDVDPRAPLTSYDEAMKRQLLEGEQRLRKLGFVQRATIRQAQRGSEEFKELYAAGGVAGTERTTNEIWYLFLKTYHKSVTGFYRCPLCDSAPQFRASQT